MHYLYLLRSESYPKQPYVGLTRDFRKRLIGHNSGRSPHTAKFCPMDACRVFRFFQRKSRDRFRKISQIGLRTSFRKASFLLRSGSHPTTRRSGLLAAEKCSERSKKTVREGRAFLGGIRQWLSEWR